MSAQELPNWLRQRAYLTPDRIALTSGSINYTFKELWENTLQLAGKIDSSIDIHSQRFVGLMIKNNIESVILIHAIQQLGIPMVLLNNRLSPHELSFQINDMGLSTVIFDDEWESTISQIDTKNNLNSIKLSTLQKAKSSSIKVKEYFQLNQICSVMYTSGTTGSPKGVLQSFGNHWWSAIGSSLNLGISEQDAWLCAVPLFHISGYSILMRSVIYGMKVHLFESFDVENINKSLKNGNITIMSVVSNMLHRLIEDIGDEHYHPHFRCMLLGGGPAPLPLLEACKEKGIPVFQTYGMTETSSQIVTLSPEYSISKLGSAGKPLFPSELKINSDEGEGSPNEEGEILVKGPNVTEGYFQRKDANEKSFKNGWFHTGDIGYIDNEGFLFVLDRRSDLIISGGENVYPAEIESILFAHTGIQDVGVIGIPNPKWGQVPCAFIVESEPKTLTEEGILSYCKEKLASYKVPKQVVIMKEIPRNASNKILRRKLREYYKQGMNSNED